MSPQFVEPNWATLRRGKETCPQMRNSKRLIGGIDPQTERGGAFRFITIPSGCQPLTHQPRPRRTRTAGGRLLRTSSWPDKPLVHTCPNVASSHQGTQVTRPSAGAFSAHSRCTDQAEEKVLVRTPSRVNLDHAKLGSCPIDTDYSGRDNFPHPDLHRSRLSPEGYADFVDGDCCLRWSPLHQRSQETPNSI